MDRKPLIDRMNPFLKILVLILITLIGSFDYKPFISGILVVSILVTAELFSSLSIMDILNSVKVFLLMSIGLIDSYNSFKNYRFKTCNDGFGSGLGLQNYIDKHIFCCVCKNY